MDVQLASPHSMVDVVDEYLKGHGIFGPDDFDLLCAKAVRNVGPVRDFLPHHGVSLLVGDSGLGKSPLAYQLGLCVAAGVPFIGLETKPGIVVYLDYENPATVAQELRQRLTKFLGFQKAPSNFHLWTLEADKDLPTMDELCATAEPALIIVDSLRSHNPEFEKPDSSGELIAELRNAAKPCGVTVLAIHHPRKRSRDGDVPKLDSENTVLMDWFNEASGARALVNQSDTRVGVDIPDGNKKNPPALILRWHLRGAGPRGPVYLERMCDETGEPVGYERLTGASLLQNVEQVAAFRVLPLEFSFAEAKRIYNASDDPTRKWLLKCTDLGLVTRLARGQYRKVVEEVEKPALPAAA